MGASVIRRLRFTKDSWTEERYLPGKASFNATCLSSASCAISSTSGAMSTAMKKNTTARTMRGTHLVSHARVMLSTPTRLLGAEIKLVLGSSTVVLKDLEDVKGAMNDSGAARASPRARRDHLLSHTKSPKISICAVCMIGTDLKDALRMRQ